MTPVPMYIKVDRSRIVTRQTCQQRRYLEYDHNGTGIRGVQSNDALEFGILMHNMLERVLKTAASPEPVEEAALWDGIYMDLLYPFSEKVKAQVTEQSGDARKGAHKAAEQVYLAEMLVYGWYKQRLPFILAEYDIESVEQEFEVALSSDIKMMLRIDAILRHKVTRLAYILDFKSLANLTDDWMVKQEHSAQSSLYIFALEQHLGEYVAGIMYEGLVKGQQRRDTKEDSPTYDLKLQSTPLCYVYTNETGEMKHEYTKAKGWRKTPAWSLHPAQAHYEALRRLYEGDLPQFCVVPPVRPPQYALERTVKQTIIAEREYHIKLSQVRGALSEDSEKELRDTLFELHYPACYKYGKDHACPFTGICHGGVSPDDETQFVPRTPHHPGEFEDE